MTDLEAEPAALLLPFYVVVDVSWSMTSQDGDAGTGIDAVNRIGPQVADALDKAPLVGDKIRFGLLDFAGDANVVIPLDDIRQITHIPQLHARTDGTSYANAFRMLRQQIEADVQVLRGDRYQVYRPAVFFLTDGEPTDETSDWQSAFAALTAKDFKARPNIIPFGIRDASKAILDQLVYPPADPNNPSKKHMRSFLAKDQSASDAIKKMIEVLIGSIIESGTDVEIHGTDGGFKLPEPEDDDDDDWVI
jgi:uncharacterized protein YegL